MSLLPTLDVLRDDYLPNTCHLRWSAQGGSVIILPGVTVGEVLHLLNRLPDVASPRLSYHSWRHVYNIYMDIAELSLAQ